LEDLSVGGMII